MKLREQMKTDLRTAMKQRQPLRVSILRTLLSAIDQAEAVDTDTSFVPLRGQRADVPRKTLSTADLQTILQDEATDLREALAEFRALGVTEQVNTLQTQLAIVQGYLQQEG